VYVLYYMSMLWCWHLIWILVRTDHPCLGWDVTACRWSMGCEPHPLSRTPLWGCGQKKTKTTMVGGKVSSVMVDDHGVEVATGHGVVAGEADDGDLAWSPLRGRSPTSRRSCEQSWA
jgi:hypothetical protein